MKKGLLTLIISATIGIVHAQNVNIPDAIFKAVLVGNSAINTNGDTEIQVSEAAAFGGTIFCASLGISDLTGIESFTALTVLNCSSNLITSLDVSQNTALTSLNCAGDGYVQGQITSLDVSLNTALTEFYCFENQLDSLNVSQNSALTILWCYENQLDSINVSQNPALTTLWCSNNQLSILDLSQNTSLGDLNCAFNQLTYLDVANGNNTNMSNFYVNNNPNLFCIDVDDVAWSTNNWTNIGAQTYFSTNCQAPPTTYVPDNNFEAYLENNGMGNGIPYDSSVFTSAIDTLTNLDLSFGAGTATGFFDLTGIEDFTALIDLDCSYNQITSLDVSQNPALTTLWCSNNQLTSLDLSQNTSLGDLNCAFNQLTYLDVANGNNTNMSNFYANNNPNLFCVDVDDGAWSTTYWTSIDPWVSFSNDCATAFGCLDPLACNYDSIATIDDGSCVYPIIWNQTYLICDGDSIVVGSSVYDTTGVYTDTLNASNGCDSIVYTYLVVDQNTSSYDTLSVTASVVWNGMPLNVSGDYSVTLTNVAGCDSITNLNLTITIPSGILNVTNTEKTLLKITDMLGQETPYKRNAPLFYIYDDGTVEKKIIIE